MIQECLQICAEVRDVPETARALPARTPHAAAFSSKKSLRGLRALAMKLNPLLKSVSLNIRCTAKAVQDG
jgi:hypothetical protein